MGKKGAKRKTRWRTLSIGTPPGEEDDEEGVRNGYTKSNQEHYVRSERNGYANGGSSSSGYSTGWLKSRHGSAGSSGSGGNGSSSNASSNNGQSNGSTTSGYASGSSRSRRDDSSQSPTQQQKIVFNEDEYTRITTPRQDVLFKKGYLSQKKPWASTTSMSATPSTTESQSASHSTADGSEAAEDQQLLDSSAVGEYAGAPVMEAAPQLSYGTYYDHASGYYYEYPMMLVAPAMPEQMGPNMLAAMPCAPVPLRPIEWVNPAFVPKLASQQYCYMDYQTAQGTDCAALVDAQGVSLSCAEPGTAVMPVPMSPASVPQPSLMNGLSNETSMTGSVSASASVSATDSVADDEALAACIVSEDQLQQQQQLMLQPGMEDMLPVDQIQDPDQELELEMQQQQELEMQQQQELEMQHQQELEMQQQQALELQVEPQYELPLDEEQMVEQPELLEYAEPPYVETLPPQPVHLAHVIPQPIGQPYIYPGQYMFGPPVVNVNGVTIQSGPMLRCSDMVASTAAAAAACAKRRRKKKKRKQKRPHALGNTEDEDEEDYSSEGENGLSSPRVSSWSTVPTATMTTTTTTGLSNRPLNPECQEFHLRSTIIAEPALTAGLNINCNMITMPAAEHISSSNFSTSTLMPMDSNGGGDAAGFDCGFEQPATEDCYYFEASPAPMLKNHLDNEPKRLTENGQQGSVTPVNGKQEEDNDDTANSKSPDELGASTTLTNGELRQRSMKIMDNGCDNPDATVIVNGGGDCEQWEHSDYTPYPEMDSQKLTESHEEPFVTQFNAANNNSAQSFKRKFSSKSLKLVREPTPGPDLDKLTSPNDEERSVEDVTVMLSTTTIAEAKTSKKDGDLDICQTWVNESSITSESCCNENNETMTTATTMRPTTDEDSGFESQSKLGSSGRPITDAVNEWLKRANSPDLFITSSATSDEDDEDDEASLSNEPSKNLQGSPMPALSVNGGADECQASHGKFATSNEPIGASEEKDVRVLDKSNGKVRRAKRKGAKCQKRDKKDLIAQENNLEYKHALTQNCTDTSVETSNALPMMVNGICEFTEKDSDAGMRVAENSRNNVRKLEDSANSCNIKNVARVRKKQENICKNRFIDDIQSVKTYEKGEIVVSMNGELLLVAPALQDSRTKNSNERRNSNSTVEDENERSLGSIEEPDVLECWEAETVEPVTTPKKTLQGDSADDDLLVVKDASTNRMEHVQRYYRLQVDSSVTSVEEDICANVALNNNLVTPNASTVPNTPDQMTDSICSKEEIPVIIPEKKAESIGQNDSKLPIDEAFEVYESCYTGKPLPFTSIGPKFDKSRIFYGRNEEIPLPCRAVCCNIQ